MNAVFYSVYIAALWEIVTISKQDIPNLQSGS